MAAKEEKDPYPKTHSEAHAITGAHRLTSSGVDEMETLFLEGAHDFDSPQRAQLQAIFEWMCDLSPTESEGNPRRSKRISHR